MHAPSVVLIHDAARPFIDAAAIDGVLGALATAPGAIVAVPVVDTLKRAGPAGRIDVEVILPLASLTSSEDGQRLRDGLAEAAERLPWFGRLRLLYG